MFTNSWTKVKQTHTSIFTLTTQSVINLQIEELLDGHAGKRVRSGGDGILQTRESLDTILSGGGTKEKDYQGTSKGIKYVGMIRDTRGE